MAQSLDGLIDFLLEEIALSGEKGVKLSDIVRSVVSFYQQTGKKARASNSTSDEVYDDATTTTALVDRHLLQQLWKWLAKHPDVLLGKDAQYNATTLADIDQRYPGCVAYALNSSAPTFDVEYHATPSRDIHAEELSSVSKIKSHGPGIYVTRDRMFLAICGHLPDPTKVFPSEWTLLSYIAATRYEGILQGELGRVTGQDKRSVPKRTDALHQKGYIVKRTVYMKGTKTSRLYLRRFAFEPVQDATSSNPWKPRGVEKLTLKYQSNQMFAILKNNPLISQENLADSLEMSTRSRLKVLSLMIRHFGRVGCVKRVKTAFGPSARSGDLQICIQYLREPSDADWMDDSEGGVNFSLSLDEIAKPDDDDSDSPDATVDDANATLELETESSTTLERNIPQWNPDRILANVLFEAAKQAGSQGLRNTDARKMITGPFVKRTLESLLIKISHQSLQSQPDGVRHLTIIRSRETVESIFHFAHYAVEFFEDNVRNGKATWDEINGASNLFKQLGSNPKNSIADIGYDMDAFGFPQHKKATGQLNGGETTQSELIKYKKIKNIVLDAGKVSSQNVGSLEFDSNEMVEQPIAPIVKRGRPRKSTNDKPERSRKRISTGQVIRGRPRKFLHGTEKFWRDMFIAAVRQDDPDYVRTMGMGGIMKSAAGMSMFLARPDNFDDVLLNAMAAGYPVPRLPEDISNRWVSDTLAMLERSENGLYFTPTGVRQHARAKISKMMVVKSTRLQELDFSDRSKTWSWQSISSSASHSIRYKPYYPTMDPPSKKSRFSLRQPKLPRATRGISSFGPPRGTFYEDRHSTGEGKELLAVANESELGRLEQSDPGLISESTDTDPDLPQHVARADAENLQESPHQSQHTPQIGHSNSASRTSPQVEDNSSILSTRPSRRRRPTQKAVQSNFTALTPEKQPSRTTDASPTPSPKMRHSQHQDLVLETPIVAEEVRFQSDETSPQLFESIVQPQSWATVVEETRPSRQATDEPLRRMETSANLDDHGSPAPTQLDVTEVDGRIAEIDKTQTSVPYDAEDEATALRAPVQNTEAREAKTPTRQSKKRPVARESSDESDVIRPPKRAKPSTPNKRVSQKEPARLCRNIIYDLIKLCSGLAPSDSWTFRRAMTARWIESGTNFDPPTAKNVRTNLRALAKGVRVKHITFAYKGKSGAMVTKSIIALRKFDSTHQAVLDLQKKMADADPQDYVPPEMSAEFDRAPSALLNWKPALEDSESENEEAEEPYIERETMITPRAASKSRSPSALEPDHTSGTASLSEAFLTLKIPRLHSLTLPTEFAVQYRVQNLSAVSEAEKTSQSASTETKTRRRGLRKRRATHFDANTHNIIWVAGKQAAMPRSLDEVPNITVSRDEAAIAGLGNPDYERFIAEVECVADWEKKTDSSVKEKTTELVFFNHVPASFDARYRPLNDSFFGKLVKFNSAGQPYEIALPKEPSWQPFVDALRETAQSTAASPTPILRRKRKYGWRKKSVSFINDDDDDFEAGVDTSDGDTGRDDVRYHDDDDDNTDEDGGPSRRSEPTKKRRGNNKRRNSNRKRGGDDDNSRKIQKLRRPMQVVRYMAAETQYRVVVSVIIIRTLAGGVEKYIDWRLVTRLLPLHEIEQLQIAWKTLLSQYRADINGLTESLQEKYLDSLAEGRVPSVNFENLDDTDWEGILTWALANLEKFQTERVDELPLDENEFHRHKQVTTEEPEGIRNCLGFGILTSQNRKDELMAGIVFGMRMSSTMHDGNGTSISLGKTTDDFTLARAKSWVFSLLLTPEASYDPRSAHKTLLKLATSPSKCEALVDAALSSLQRDKAISRGRESSKFSASAVDNGVTGVRTWQVSIKYYEQLNFRRQITGSMLKVAARYKLEVLDVAFSQGQPLLIGRDFMSDDGEMIAIINLLAMGAVRIRTGDDVPDTRYGLGWEKQGYSTRLVDKSLLGFSVVLEPLPYAYEYGDPLDDSRSRVVIPRGEIDDLNNMGRIPPWFDINLDFLPEMWDMCLGAVVGLISIRPGADAQELSQSTANALAEWEVSLIVHYLEDLGAIRRTRSGHGFETQVWWWMSLATTADGENDEEPVAGVAAAS